MKREKKAEVEDLDEVSGDVYGSVGSVGDVVSSKRMFSQHFDANIKMFGDKTTLTQIIILLAYLRYHIQTKTPGEIKVSVAKHLDTESFAFSVNDQEVQQIHPAEEIEIN